MELPVLIEGEDKSSPFCNNLRKNYRHIRKWAKRTETNAFRIYDRDIKEYPLTVDYYDGRFLVQYYSSLTLQEEVEKTLYQLFGESKIHTRERFVRQRTEQYEKLNETKVFFEVLEYGVKFWVNLNDYLDTGLFLDHRETRQMVASLVKGKSLLNLFAYTCSFSVHAALKGALHTKSVDLSNTYLGWGKENFRLNQISTKTHEFVRADCLKFLDEETDKYDVIVIDPPTLSRSKKMDQFFDIQQDYPHILSKALDRLNPQGTLFFSTNSRKFEFDESLFPHCKIQNISKKTIPIDFHNEKIHYCWKMQFIHSF